MVTQIIKKAVIIFMQFIWKVVQPEDLKLGDHIYTYGLYGLYSHHGIYIGKGYVIHFTRTQSKKAICPSLSKMSHEQEICLSSPECDYHESIKRGVVKTCLDCFRWDGQRLRSLHRYEYGWPLLGFLLTRRGTCTMLHYTKSPRQVVDKACEFRDNKAFGDYSLLYKNCEHFATFCRTNIKKSERTAFASNCARKIRQGKEWTFRLLRRD